MRAQASAEPSVGRTRTAADSSELSRERSEILLMAGQPVGPGRNAAAYALGGSLGGKDEVRFDGDGDRQHATHRRCRPIGDLVARVAHGLPDWRVFTRVLVVVVFEGACGGAAWWMTFPGIVVTTIWGAGASGAITVAPGGGVSPG